jgi:hypothetical protein
MTGNQTNVEYWFRLLYDCIRGACYGSTSFADLSAKLAHVWLWIIIIGYLLSALALFVIVYSLVRLFDLRHREHEFLTTLIELPEKAGGPSSRWAHVEELVGSSSASDWRAAIIEADIMLDDLLSKQGYAGAGVGEKLKLVDRSKFGTLEDAWEAHKVRNDIAHRGSSVELTESLARRTIARYSAVFREFGVI